MCCRPKSCSASWRLGAATEGQVRRGRRSAPGERVQVVELELMLGRTSLTGVTHEGALAAIARPDLVPNGGRDISTPRRRRLGGCLPAGAAAATLDARQSDAQALVQYLLQSGAGQLVRERPANGLEVGDESGIDRHPEDVAVRSDRLQRCRGPRRGRAGAGAGCASPAGGVGEVGAAGGSDEAGIGGSCAGWAALAGTSSSCVWWVVLSGTGSGPEPLRPWCDEKPTPW
jgi:hypothetical protein